MYLCCFLMIMMMVYLVHLDQVDQVDQIWTQWSTEPTQRTDPVGRPSAQLHIYYIYRLYICKLVDIYAKTNRKQIAQT